MFMHKFTADLSYATNNSFVTAASDSDIFFINFNYFFDLFVWWNILINSELAHGAARNHSIANHFEE